MLCCGAPGRAQGSPSSLPASLGAPQAEVDTVQALVCIGAIAAFVTALRMAHTLKKQAFPFIQRDAFAITSGPLGPCVRVLQWAGSFKRCHLQGLDVYTLRLEQCPLGQGHIWEQSLTWTPASEVHPVCPTFWLRNCLGSHIQCTVNVYKQHNCLIIFVITLKIKSR